MEGEMRTKARAMEEGQPIRILIADDHPVVRQGLAVIIDTEPGMTVVAQAKNGREAVDMYRSERPHIALIDLKMPNWMESRPSQRSIKSSRRAALLVLTTYDRDEDISRSLRAGAKAYFSKMLPRQSWWRPFGRSIWGTGICPRRSAISWPTTCSIPI